MDYYQKNIQYFLGQHYQTIRKECLASETPFEDSTFLPQDDSIFLTNQNVSLVWKRPQEISNHPFFVVDGTSSVDVNIGYFASPSFVAACSILASYPDLWKRVVPDVAIQQRSMHSDSTREYAGIFRFRFWRFGKWFEVVVDDNLPTRNGQLFGIYSKQSNEFWSALLEKAYAKLLGCYEAIRHHNAGLILQDLTGGVLQHVQLAHNAKNVQWQESFFDELKNTKRNTRAMVTCWINPREVGEEGSETAQGLLMGHVYAVNAVKELKLGSGPLRVFKSAKVRLVKLRNPTGSKEWCGAWSDSSEEWRQLSDAEKRRQGLTFEEDGEFWMSYEDFCSEFTAMSVCYAMHAASIIGESWMESAFFGNWICHSDPDYNTAGGSLMQHSTTGTFLQNPQYRFEISGNSTGELVIELEQEEPREHASFEKKLLHEIGLYIVKIEANRSFALKKLIEGGKEYEHVRTRSMLVRKAFDKGRYAIIPSTSVSAVGSKFLLRIYSKTNVRSCELIPRYPDQTCWAFCVGYPTMITRVTVTHGINCVKLEGKVADSYVLIGCEGQVVRSQTFKGNKNPKFDISAVFYRKNPNKPILITLYHDGLLCDKFMGQGLIEGTVDNTASAVEIPLYGRGNMEEKRYPGTLFIDVVSSEDIHAL